jgi:hypothetical protein
LSLGIDVLVIRSAWGRWHVTEECRPKTRIILGPVHVDA